MFSQIEAAEASFDDKNTLAKMNSFLEDACKSSCEGIIAKSLDVNAGYAPSKRSDAWLKVCTRVLTLWRNTIVHYIHFL